MVATAPAKVTLVEPAAAPIEKEVPVQEIVRPSVARTDESEINNANDGSYNEDLLDIPAFLRRQAD